MFGRFFGNGKRNRVAEVDSDSLATRGELMRFHVQSWERDREIEKRTRRGRIVEIIRSEHAREAERLEKLRDDCVRVLALLKSKGLVTQAEINEATDG